MLATLIGSGAASNAFERNKWSMLSILTGSDAVRNSLGRQGTAPLSQIASHRKFQWD